MEIRLIFLIVSLIFGTLIGEDYTRNPHVDENTWNLLKPYFLPAEESVKKKLDAIFSRSKRPTESLKTLVEAGFKLTSVQGIRVKVLKHPGIPGYVFKILTDDQDSRPDVSSWLSRVKGAEVIRQAIKELGVQHFFFVPEKWIYPLPAEPSPSIFKEGGRKNFILIAKNVHPCSRERNVTRWMELSNTKVLDALYAILMKTGAADSIKENNIPWCKNNKIAFVDTEHYHDFANIRFARLEKVLNPKMKLYWQSLRSK